MNLPAPSGDIGVQIGDAVDDGHGGFVWLNIEPLLAPKRPRPNSQNGVTAPKTVMAGLVPAIHV